ncbi:NAD(P)-dependent oxidoreductase [Olivibacter sitiensis]|uniref:NAD(P)-dependent oxidoreductase n=1 Tax=Olivibacter sitiensis TaxID=376470 RepID=UPI00048A21EC|nr:NAD(P)-dependent oxidoreductase [Olivibacter sitiensis]
MRLGWLGIGNMGNPMAGNLLKAGYSLTVYNRTAERAKPLIEKGAKQAKDQAELVEGCDVIFTMLSDDKAVEEVYLGNDGLFTKPVKGTLFINMSTVAPGTSEKLYHKAKKRDANFIEAPVSGSVKPAEDATLVILAAGDKEDMEGARPLLEKLGKLVLYTGAIGKGAIAKLSINYFLALTLQGLAESVLFAKSHGIEPTQMLSIVNEGACGSGITKLKSPAILKGEFPPAFALKHMAKDLRLIRDEGITTPVAKPVIESYQRALEKGLGDEDVMAIISYLEKA